MHQETTLQWQHGAAERGERSKGYFTLPPPGGSETSGRERVSGEGRWNTDRASTRPPRRLVPRLRPSQREGEVHCVRIRIEGATNAFHQTTLSYGNIRAAQRGERSKGYFTLPPPGGSETSASEFPGRVVGTPIELLPALPEGSFLAFDPPRERVKSIACEYVSKGRRMRSIKPPFLMATFVLPREANEAKDTSPSRRREGRKRARSEFPGRVVGTPIELLPALPEGSFLAFDPPRERVKSIACEYVSKGRRMRSIRPPFFKT